MIPIRNLYYLFSYAWARFPQGPIDDVGLDACPSVLDLFAHLFVGEARALLRRALAQDYEPCEQDLPAPRGRIALDATIRRQTRLRNRIACRFDEFTSNQILNQIVKAGAKMLAVSNQINADHRDALNAIVAALGTIDDIRLSIQLFRTVSVAGGLRRYRFILSICELLVRAALPDQEGKASRFADVLENEVVMSSIFESFLRNFYTHEQSDYRVAAETLLWDAMPRDAASAALLPQMGTDISLRGSERILIAEAKFYPEALTRHFDKPRLRSDHLYQLFAYLEHADGAGTGLPVDGLLIYPVAAWNFTVGYRLRGHGVRVETLDLMQHWSEIHANLLTFLDPVVVAGASNVEAAA